MDLKDFTIEAEADTLEEARQKINVQLYAEDVILAEHILQDGDAHTIQTSADTADEAFALAEKQVPDGADIAEKKLTIPAERKVIEVDAFDEAAATAMAKAQFKGSVLIKSLRMAAPGRKGFLGIGNKPNKYEVDVFQQAAVEVRYKTKAKISMDICKREDLKFLLYSSDGDEQVNVALILLKSSDQADRLDAAAALEDKKQGLRPLFEAVAGRDEKEQQAISQLFWHTLWDTANAEADSLPPMQKSLAKIEDPRQQLALFSSMMADIFGGVPEMARTKELMTTNFNYQVEAFQMIVEGMVKQFVFNNKELGPEQIQTVNLIMSRVYGVKETYRCRPDLQMVMQAKYPTLKVAELEALGWLSRSPIKEASDAILGFMAKNTLDQFIVTLREFDKTAADYLAEAQAAKTNQP